MSFDDIIDRRNTHSAKWDAMEKLYGVSPDTGISMWVADMDLHSPDCVRQVLRDQGDSGVYGYFADYGDYHDAIGWWMKTRHDWSIEPDWIFSTAGLVNAVGLCLDAFTQPGDGIVLFTPVYHAFARAIRNAGRTVVECEMAQTDGAYALDFDAYDAAMTGSEKMLILCSPHNPGGRVWTRDELRAVADFAKRHDLLIISDEIHSDLVFGGHKHLPFPIAVPDAVDRTIMLTASSKTFNIAGVHVGNVIIEDPDLRARFAARMSALAISTNSLGTMMVTAAYSPDGAAWVDELLVHLQSNEKLFRDGINQIPGLSAMKLQSTYLAWVDFSGTGMPMQEFQTRVAKDAGIAANLGPTFGKGGDAFIRFNFATRRAVVEDAVDRMQRAFSDLQ